VLVSVGMVESNFRQIWIVTEGAHCISLDRPLTLPSVEKAMQKEGKLLAR
jgi:hypothetical protein